MDWSIAIIVFQLIFLEGILSIDNAAVLGALVSPLPDDRAIIWPTALKEFGQKLHAVLGNQRTGALRVGLLGAYLGRGLMLFMASIITRNPWLRLIGALYLIRLAFDTLGKGEEGETDSHTHRAEAARFWGVVVMVELTDLIFSIDNVVAAVALSNKFWIVMLGVAIGILMMRFAAGWFSYAVEREPVLRKTAYILILNIGIELILEEITGLKFGDWSRFIISLSTIGLSLLYVHFKPLQILQPVLDWLAEGFANINEVIDWVLTPFGWILRLIWRGLTGFYKLCMSWAVHH